jgi:hypothetical protein
MRQGLERLAPKENKHERDSRRKVETPPPRLSIGHKAERQNPKRL